MPTAPTVHRALPFCKAPCSMDLVGSAAVEHALALDFDYAGGDGNV